MSVRRTDYQAKAARCRALAEAAKDDAGRKLWSNMEQYWLRCEGGQERPMGVAVPMVLND